ncbi:MAG: hypothetical protein V1736_09800 [Pseudomonadota bacterium]
MPHVLITWNKGIAASANARRLRGTLKGLSKKLLRQNVAVHCVHRGENGFLFVAD